jgi:hypothetical protein
MIHYPHAAMQPCCLRLLDLHFNRIGAVDGLAAACQGLPHLHTLNLMHNRLQAVCPGPATMVIR